MLKYVKAGDALGRGRAVTVDGEAATQDMVSYHRLSISRQGEALNLMPFAMRVGELLMRHFGVATQAQAEGRPRAGRGPSDKGRAALGLFVSCTLLSAVQRAPDCRAQCSCDSAQPLTPLVL